MLNMLLNRTKDLIFVIEYGMFSMRKELNI
jgi:hypothetical protein